MRKIRLMNTIAPAGLAVLERGEYCVGTEVEAPDAILVRSAVLHEEPIGPELLAVARAGAGVNNIPLSRMAENGTVVFNTPGANANGVKELAVAALLLASRDVVGGIDWVRQLGAAPDLAAQVEAGKGRFSGQEILGRTLGVIGLGAIGGAVANAAQALGMRVIGYDPFLTVHGAWGLSHAVQLADSYEQVYEAADYLTLHVPSTAQTRGMLSHETLARMRPGVRILNLSRADLVNLPALEQALRSGQVGCYITDFPVPELCGLPNTVMIPHLGASTAESEENCAVMAAQSLREYLETGNLHHAVNYPDLSLPHTGAARLCCCHRNRPGMLSCITDQISGSGINIENMANASRGEYAYTLMELSEPVGEAAVAALSQIDGMLRVRVL